MITFASLFLGLMIGIHPVEVLTGEAVAEIELFLDGRSLATLDAPPWRTTCDFGEQLLPHELVAVGRDTEGNEVDQARQWVNLPRPAAEVNITLLDDDNGQPTRVRLSWTIVAGKAPRVITLTFDGKPLEVDDPEATPLPRHDPRQLHFLRAEVDFGDGLASVSELVFGGTYADRVASEITAVPLILERRVKKLSPEALSGWLVKDGAPLAIVAVDRGLADLVIVTDTTARAMLNEMSRRAPQRISELAAPDSIRTQLTEPSLRGDQDRRIEFVFPVAEQHGPHGAAYDLFPHSQKLVGDEARMPTLLFGIVPPTTPGPQRLADAVAVAGVTAAASNLRRGVLLILSGEAPDASDITPAIARRYLEALRVPLFVWTLRRDLPSADAWGPAVAADGYAKLEAASSQLFRELDRQRMVWVTGRHLPQSVRLGTPAKGVRLAGSAGGAP